ncbi:MAG: ammonia-forming cytochrome c nitrite reductase subunit c552 [Thermoanaerobaculales bacterium]
MRSLTSVMVVLALLLIPSAWADEPVLRASHRPGATARVSADLPADMMATLTSMYTTKELEEGLAVVGDEYCIACHSWSAITHEVKHRQALRVPMGQNTLISGKGVVADYDQNGVDDFMQGLDFNTISSVFDQYKPNAPILSYNTDTDTYWMTIGELTVKIVITQGGTGAWKQRYLTQIPVTGTPSGWTRDNYVSPLQFNEKTFEWVAYHPEHWWDADNQPNFGAQPAVQDVAATGRSYSKRCIGCHTTNFRETMSQDDNGEWIYRPFPASLVPPDYKEQYPDYDHDGIPDIINIGCEACHGPGSAHVLGGGDPDEILAPSELDTFASNEICQQCHVRTASVPNGTYGYPYRDDVGENWIPGRTEAPMGDFYEEKAGWWPDGVTSKKHHQQYEDLYNSSKPTFVFHEVKCVECHSPHKGGKHMVVTKIVDDGLTIPTENDNNTLCLACHATHGDFEEITKEQVAEYEENELEIGAIVAAHSNHPYGPERSMGLSRCSKCHMPKTAKSAIKWDIHGHTYEPIAPEKTLMYQADGGMPNSCAVSCHSLKVNSFGLGLDPDIGAWDDPFDVELAEELEVFFGPGGLWWDTDEEHSITKRALDNAAVPGSYVPPTNTEDISD